MHIGGWHGTAALGSYRARGFDDRMVREGYVYVFDRPVASNERFEGHDGYLVLAGEVTDLPVDDQGASRLAVCLLYTSPSPRDS